MSDYIAVAIPLGLACVGLGMALDAWISDRWQRIRYCECCHSDSTENGESFRDICDGCLTILRQERRR